MPELLTDITTHDLALKAIGLRNRRDAFPYGSTPDDIVQELAQVERELHRRREERDHQPGARRTNGGRIESYTVKPSAGLGGLNWPTGFDGGGWALLDKSGNVVSRHAFRFAALQALIDFDGLDGVMVEDIAGDVSES